MYAELSKIQWNAKTKPGAGPHTLVCNKCKKSLAEGDEIGGPSRNKPAYGETPLPVWTSPASPSYAHKFEYWHIDCSRPQGRRTTNLNNIPGLPAAPTGVIVGSSGNDGWQRGAGTAVETKTATPPAPPPTTPNDNNNNTNTNTNTNSDMIADIINAIQSNILPQLERVTDSLENKLDGHIATNLAHNTAAYITELKSAASDAAANLEVLTARVTTLENEALTTSKTLVVKLRLADGTYNESSVGVAHKMFPLLFKLAKSLQNKQRNIWLSGPAGSGKTTAAEQLATLIFGDTDHYYYTGAIDTEYKLSGFIDANGVAHNTQFKTAWTTGGVFLFDEIDRALTGALLKFNAALANGYCDFPDGSHPRHPDCYILAAANTWGFGGDANYVGANKLDAAFLSRFPVKLSWGYDESLEHVISGNSIATPWVTAVQSARRLAFANKAKVVFDPRQSMAGGQLLHAGLLTRAEIADSIFGMYRETLALYDTICAPITQWVAADPANTHMATA